jgi:hypothetical protein
LNIYSLVIFYQMMKFSFSSWSFVWIQTWWASSVVLSLLMNIKADSTLFFLNFGLKILVLLILRILINSVMTMLTYLWDNRSRVLAQLVLVLIILKFRCFWTTEFILLILPLSLLIVSIISSLECLPYIFQVYIVIHIIILLWKLSLVCWLIKLG